MSFDGDNNNNRHYYSDGLISKIKEDDTWERAPKIQKVKIPLRTDVDGGFKNNLALGG